MARRPQRELELLPHYVYKHFGTKGVIYVGMTSDPEGRPTDTKRRPWIKTESKRIEVSPPMSFEAAAWVERSLIRAHNPEHNERCGNLHIEKRDWRIDRLCELEGMPVTSARWWLQYLPEDRDEFEAVMARRKVGPSPDEAAALEALFGPIYT